MSRPTKSRRSMGRRRTDTDDEADLAARDLYPGMQRPGVTSEIKRRSRRRDRHEAKAELQEIEVGDDE